MILVVDVSQDAAHRHNNQFNSPLCLMLMPTDKIYSALAEIALQTLAQTEQYKDETG